jgi:hypothetical protein
VVKEKLMSITRIHSFLVHPSKNEETQPPISGVEVPHTGRLFEMLSSLDSGAESECDIDITFRPQEEGIQQNDCRDLLLHYLGKPTLQVGIDIATRLQKLTTKRSGLGLLFLIVGKNQHGHRLLLSRFPAESGVMAEEKGKTLDVTFVEKVFMKSAKAYKSVLFRCPTLASGFWKGIAVDRQMDDQRGAADYWIRGFLESELTNTAAAGTKRMAQAIQKAIRSSADPVVRQELMSAAQILRGRQGKTASAAKIVRDMSLSADAEEAIKTNFPRPELYSATFKFDLDEYDSLLMFRSVELDNGAMLIAENSSFDSIFHTEQIGHGNTKRRYTTEGSIVSEKLKKTR